jgi:hypothetical protein
MIIVVLLIGIKKPRKARIRSARGLSCSASIAARYVNGPLPRANGLKKKPHQKPKSKNATPRKIIDSSEFGKNNL